MEENELIENFTHWHSAVNLPLSVGCRVVSIPTAKSKQKKPNAVMEIPGGLKIYTLGRIEFLNPMWHTKDLIYPVGYHVRFVRALSTV